MAGSIEIFLLIPPLNGKPSSRESLRDHNLNFVYVSSVNERLTENFTRRHEGTKKNKDGKDSAERGQHSTCNKMIDEGVRIWRIEGWRGRYE